MLIGRLSHFRCLEADPAEMPRRRCNGLQLCQGDVRRRHARGSRGPPHTVRRPTSRKLNEAENVERRLDPGTLECHKGLGYVN
jgi:hypothetical protein